MSNELAVPLGLLRRYLAFHGWKRPERVAAAGGVLDEDSFAAAFFRERSNGHRNVDLYVLSEPGEDEIEIAVPLDMGSREAMRRLEGAIKTISQLEDKDPVQVVADIRAIGFDVVRSRVPDDLVIEDTIHLEQAVGYTAHMKKLLAASATTEISPDVYFFRVKKEASLYADNCRFAHTCKGSFGFTIESPVTPNAEPVFPGMEQQPPFERRVIQRIAKGITVIQEAVAAQDPELAIQAFQTGFNANVCEEFAELIQQTAPSGMGFGFFFSPEWPAPEVGELGELWVGPQHVEMSQVAAKRMRERAPMQPREISGRIIRLENEADPQDLEDQTHEREIVIYWKSEEFGGMNVRVLLGPTEYLAAIQAHLRGHAARATGRLEKRGRFWWLADITEFSA